MRAAARSTVQHGVLLGECMHQLVALVTCARAGPSATADLYDFHVFVWQQVAANKRPKRALGSSHVGNSSIGRPSSRANRQSNAGIIEANRNVSSPSIIIISKHSLTPMVS
jgi:hypothetical protein